jgi:pimeloyl-ACP methyl ester carboxylesterase
MSACEECQSSFGCMGKASPCNKCNKLLCSTCSGKYALIPFDATKPEESNDLQKNGTIQSYCKPCFQQVSVLHYTKTFEEMGPRSTTTGNEITFVMVHGGGSSRAMFRPHAKVLAKRGYRCILLDLPGHGTMVETPLSLDACVDTVKSVLEACKLGQQPTTTIYVGGSLGAYTGMYVLDKLKDLFGGAVLIDCGQNVGPDCSLKAILGIWFLKTAANNMSNKGLLNAMVGVTKKSPADYKMVESVVGAGMFFEQGAEQTVCMHSVAPAELIPNYDFPVLFLNGSEDYRDSENKWLSLCKDQERSSLKVYEGGDHFFCHDSRFVDDMLDRMDKFAQQATGN